jgi:hypothetical protein
MNERSVPFQLSTARHKRIQAVLLTLGALPYNVSRCIENPVRPGFIAVPICYVGYHVGQINEMFGMTKRYCSSNALYEVMKNS